MDTVYSFYILNLQKLMEIFFVKTQLHLVTLLVSEKTVTKLHNFTKHYLSKWEIENVCFAK